MVDSGILVMLYITLSDVMCERMMLNLSAIVMLTAGVLSILRTHHPGICDQLPPPGAGIGSHSGSDHLSRSGHWQREVRADDQQQ